MKYNNVKKTIIHLLSIIMAISAVVASSLLVSAQSAATIENNYARLMQLQANAVAANECLNESFGHDASESFVGIDGKTYYAVITAKTNEGVYGTTNLSQ